MKNNTVDSCKIIDLKQNKTNGIINIENNIDIPFDVKRLYYLYDISDNSIRGEHAHKELNQLIIGLNKGLTITLDDGENKKTLILDNMNQGLLIVPGIWRTLSDFSAESICLVLASELYTEADYIRNYNEFLNYKK